MISFLNVNETCRWLLWAQHAVYQMKWVVLFLYTFNFNIEYVHLLQQLQQRSYATLMLSHAFCNPSQSLFFECTIDPSSSFSNAPQICWMGLRSGLWGVRSSFSIFSRFLTLQVDPPIVCFMGIITNLLNMPSVQAILGTTVCSKACLLFCYKSMYLFFTKTVHTFRVSRQIVTPNPPPPPPFMVTFSVCNFFMFCWIIG